MIDPPPSSSGGIRPRVVIVGGGFGGLSAARTLRRAPVDVVLVDRSNHHLFQPLLYQVATAALSPSEITAPIRWLLRSQRNATVLLGTVKEIDTRRRTIRVELENDSTEIPFDFLILSAGTRHFYFGRDAWERHAPGLKTIEDALEIRSRFLVALERAEWTNDPAERKALQTFVIVGGGPTGVELAGILPEIAHRTMAQDFRRMDHGETRVILLEAGPRLLPTFSEQTSRVVASDLIELGVEVRCGTTVTGITPGEVRIGEESIAAHTVFWAAGNRGVQVAQTLDAPMDAQGRIKVDEDLSVPGCSNVFVVGDLAAVEQNGRLVPGVAQGAIQGGRTAARNIIRTLQGKPRQAFRYRDRGNAATIGRNKAVVEIGSFRMSGRPAWLFWLFLHILYLAGFRNRIMVLFEWAYAYFSFRRGARLITGR